MMPDIPTQNDVQTAIQNALGDNSSVWTDNIYNELSVKNLFAHADAGPTIGEVKLAIHYAINDYYEAITHRGSKANLVMDIYEALLQLGVLKPQS